MLVLPVQDQMHIYGRDDESEKVRDGFLLAKAAGNAKTAREHDIAPA